MRPHPSPQPTLPLPDRHAFACELLRRGHAELQRVRAMRGAYRRTARRLAAATAMLALAAGLLGLPLAEVARAATPQFRPPVANPFGLEGPAGLQLPSFTDIDGDGDLDAFSGGTYPGVVFGRNVGTPTAPGFDSEPAPPSLPLGEIFGPNIVGYLASHAFGDIDGDGDFDILVGERYGNTFFFENTGSANSPSFAAPTANPFGLIDVGSYSMPALADIDGDGDLDLLVGGQPAGTLLFENTGTTIAPAFTGPVTNPFGLIDVDGFGAPALADLDGDGDLDMLVGQSAGLPQSLKFFENEGTATAPAFAAPVGNPFGLTSVGLFTAPAFADIDGDGDFDAFVGTAYSFFTGATVFFENATACAAAPLPGCVTGFTGTLLVDERSSGKEKLRARLRRGPALAQTDFGDPLGPGGTDHFLCLYDGADALAGQLIVERAGELCDGDPCWETIGGPPPAGNGYRYDDGLTASDGVKQIRLGAGSRASKVTLKAQNNAAQGQVALPTGIAAALATSTEVTVQLQTSDAGCFATTLTEVVRQENDLFKAK